MKTTSKWNLKYPEASEAVKDFPTQMNAMATSIDTAMTNLNNTVNTNISNLKTSVNTSIGNVKQRLSVVKMGTTTMTKSGNTFTNANISKYSVLGFGVSAGIDDQAKEEFIITGPVVNGKCAASGTYFVNNSLRTAGIVCTVSGNTLTYQGGGLTTTAGPTTVKTDRRIFTVYGIC
jgi:hypothetical protein